MAHPQTNGLVEVTNRAMIRGLKRRVTNAKGTWVDELPSILWASRTTPKITTGESPFSLAFGTEAVLPPEVVFLTLRIENFKESTSDDELRTNLDFIEERRANAHF